MRSPLENGPWLEVDEVGSTQDRVASLLLTEPQCPGVLFAHDQTGGRGRFGRTWESNRGESLTMSLVFAPQPKPWLIGMAVSIACARAVGGGVQWPNDIVMGGRKVGGVLTEMLATQKGATVPVVGVGINLNQTHFPSDLVDKASSVMLATGARRDPIEVAKAVLLEIERLPEPTEWQAISSEWMRLDMTSGKQYRLHSGESAVALEVSDEGALVCQTEREIVTVLAADALFGAP